tara:strand:+ start:383 stop:724 length:342 start_codon:yes stop_codon:yes gene_type:complete
MGPKQKFGATVRRKREQLEIGLREMAKKIGISPTHLSKIERDQYGVVFFAAGGGQGYRHPAAHEYVLKTIERTIRLIVSWEEQSDDTAAALLWLADTIAARAWEDLPTDRSLS